VNLTGLFSNIISITATLSLCFNCDSTGNKGSSQLITWLTSQSIFCDELTLSIL